MYVAGTSKWILNDVLLSTFLLSNHLAVQHYNTTFMFLFLDRNIDFREGIQKKILQFAWLKEYGLVSS